MRPDVDGGDIDQDVGLPIGIDGLVGHPGQRLAIAEIGGHIGGATPGSLQSGHGVAQACLAAAHDDHARAGLAEGAGQGTSDSRAPAGHQSHPAGQREQLVEELGHGWLTIG